MSESWIPMLVATPIALAGLTVLGRPGRRWPSAVLLAGLGANLAAGVVLVAATRDGSVLAHHVGGWPAGIAIPFVVDAFSGLMITATALLLLVCVAFAVVTGVGRLRLFAPLALVLTAGVNGALMTADLFNLFVFIEVMLLPSYGLLVISRPDQGTLASVVGSRLYVSFNLFVSTLFLAGVALVYGTAGTVNLAELAGAASDSPTVGAAAAVCLFALTMKAAVVPVHGWLARAYPSTSPAITALFSGLHTKVAIYAVYRVYAVIFDGDQRYLWIGVAVFSLTMAVGVLGAAGEKRMRSILAFHMVSQIGYILLGVALFTQAGLAAGIFYLLHHMIVKASLFLSVGAIETRYGTDRLDQLEHVVRREPWLAAAFGVAALSLAGLPPFSGFVAKLTLIMAALEAGEVVAAVTALVVSLVTLLSMLKIFRAVFAPTLDGRAAGRESASGEPGGTGTTPVLTMTRTRERVALATPAVVLAAVTIVLGLGAQGLLDLAGTAAAGLVDTGDYVRAVLR